MPFLGWKAGFFLLKAKKGNKDKNKQKTDTNTNKERKTTRTKTKQQQHQKQSNNKTKTKQTKQKQNLNKRKHKQETQKHLNLLNPNKQEYATPQSPKGRGKQAFLTLLQLYPTQKKHNNIKAWRKQTNNTFCHVQKQPIFDKFLFFQHPVLYCNCCA